MEQELKQERINEQLKQEIFIMIEEDQKMRKSDKWNSEIDKRNTERMREIIKQYGWPGKSLVSEDGSDDAWLLVQHADHDIEFQKQALELLREAVKKGEAEKRNEAYLADRVKVNSNEPQIFGTQFYKDSEGKFGPQPIEDIQHLEERRKDFGLEPFYEYEKRMREMYKEFENKFS